MKGLAQHKGLLYGVKVSPKGDKLPLDLQNSNVCQPNDNLLWLHMCALHQDTRTFFEQHTQLDQLVIDAMLAEETRPRILLREKGVMLILRAMNVFEKNNPEDMISLRIWIDNKRVITTRRRDIKSVEDVKNFIENNQGPCTTGQFLTMITDRVYQRMDPFIEDLEDCIASLEEKIAHNHSSDAIEKSGSMRIRTAIFNRYISPQKIILETLIKEKTSWINESDREHLVESHDRVTRYVETLNDLRDRAFILNDEINKMQDARLNSTAYLFSLAATIFLPLSFLTGLMGINIGGMPGVNSPHAFWVFSFSCLVIIGFQVFLFKKKKWF